MPEIKHNFLRGRMNKDLDERIVPNGEYRDAMNIQVSTSEDSDVGTIQNVLGNTLVKWLDNSTIPILFEQFSSYRGKVVGSVADEKNDCLYYFHKDMPDMSGQDVLNAMDNTNLVADRWLVLRDRIIRYTSFTDTTDVIFVDAYLTASYIHENVNFYSLWSNNQITLELPWENTEDPNGCYITEGITMKAYNSGGFVTSTVVDSVIQSSQFGSTGLSVVEIIPREDFTSYTPDNTWYFVFERPKALELPSLKVITGINIIDDLLFFTDNFNEPKKININRSRQGTNQTGFVTTKIFVNDALTDLPVLKENVTVIKKSPKTPLCLDLKTNRVEGVNYTGVMTISTDPLGATPLHSFVQQDGNLEPNSPNDFSNVSVGDTIYFKVDTDISNNNQFDLAWNIGDSIVLKEFKDDGSPPALPITDYRIKGTITSANYSNPTSQDWDGNSCTETIEFNSFRSNAACLSPSTQVAPSWPNDAVSLTCECDHFNYAHIALKITAINGFPPAADPATSILKYAVDLYDAEEKLFEFKFPRFGYRWKYEDGEYSCFSPFTEVAFLAGSFDFNPKKGYNLGMTNQLKELTVTDFITEDIPDDVVEIDILYKDEPSPNIYVVSTLSPKDEPIASSTFNNWDLNSYTINSETIYAVLPANQLLRPWDNVPLKALAQDVTGNRIVYANYVQNFDLLNEDGTNYIPSFVTAVSSTFAGEGTGLRSIKSLREYQVGVVFVDEFGRETPVLSNKSGTFKLEKDRAPLKNTLEVSFNGENYPQAFKYFKFFIKETSNEYYNMAMDRFYDAEDGNIWIAFPSSDRNKIDIDTFLILKKGLDSVTFVNEEARYKVLAIENEAPDYVKTVRNLILSPTHNSSVASTDFGWSASMEDAPSFGGDSFAINFQDILYNNGFGLDIHEKPGKYYVEFKDRNTNEFSNRYRILDITNDWDGDITNLPGTKTYFKIKGSFREDINFISDDPTGVNSTQIRDDIQTRIWRYDVENRPQFDGRFFVKILNDDVFQKYIRNLYYSSNVDFRVSTSKKIFNLHSVDNLIPAQTYQLNDGSGNPATHPTKHPYEFFKYDNYHNQDIGTLNSSFTDIWAQSGSSFDPANTSHEFGKEDYYDYHHQYKWHFLSWLQNWKVHDEDNNSIITQVEQTSFGDECEAEGWMMSLGCSDSNTTPPPSGTIWGTYGGFSSPWYSSSMFATTPPVLADGESSSGWFIDSGLYKATSPYPSLNHDIIHPVGERVRRNDKLTPQYGSGINTYAGGFDIDLGFGGLWHTDWVWSDTAYSGANWITPNPQNPTQAIGSKNGYYEAISDFFSIGRDGGSATYTDQVGFVNNLVTGKRFRFKEDPNKTVYTIKTDINESNRIRYRRNDEDDYQTGCEWNHATGSWDTGFNSGCTPSLPPYTMSSFSYNGDNDLPYGDNFAGLKDIRGRSGFNEPGNFTKNFIISCEPELTWDPVTPTSDGMIANGSVINIDLTSSATVFNANAITNNTPHEYFVTVDTLVGTDANGDPIVITPGLALTAADSVVLNNPLVIDTIDEQSSTEYRLYLKGLFRASETADLPDAGAPFNLGGGETLEFKQPVMNGFNPTFVDNYNWTLDKKGNINQPEHGTLAAVGYTIEFLEPIEDISILPENPAVWETEPKENTDLDIYFEASRANPLNISDLVGHEIVHKHSNALQAQTGSGAVSDSGALTPGATITGFGIDPNTGEIDPLSIQISNTVNPGFSPACGGQWDIVSESFVDCLDAGFGNAVLSVGDIFTIKSCDIEIDIELENALSLGTVTFPSHPMPLNPMNNILNYFKFKPLYSGTYRLNWHNCYTFGNGVESNRIRDNFNQPFILNGVKASTTLAEQYKRERRKSGLIFSGIYNSISGVNNLNQFIQAEKITKDINPIYGSIQKLHSRDTDLITLCEDKVLKILANKDAVFNADGNPQLTANERVLGQTMPFVGEYGISTNPESFASDSYRAYFVDRVRGAVLRLSRDGLTPISESGMRDWFNDKLASIDDYSDLDVNPHIIGSFDKHKKEYNLTILDVNNVWETLTYREEVKGWVSFKSFIQDSGISVSNSYFTFKEGAIWKHNNPSPPNNPTNYNNFYGNFTNSSFTVLLNDQPSIVKSFNTLNYEGTQSRITPNTSDDQYYNLTSVAGWAVDYIKTDLEDSSLDEFIEKEGKWFNYLKGKTITTTSTGTLTGGFDSSDFAIQGLGVASGNVNVSTMVGCTDPTMFNYNFAAGTDCTDANGITNGTAGPPYTCCEPIISGCTSSWADNYNSNANTDDGSCTLAGCTDSAAINYDPNATTNNGTCTYPVSGCTDPAASNYNPLATTDDGSCIATIYGCTDAAADNTAITTGNVFTDVNSPCTDPADCPGCSGGLNPANLCCQYTEPGCPGPACNPSTPSANYYQIVDDGSCEYCNNTYADNYDANASCDNYCVYCPPAIDNSYSGPLADAIPTNGGLLDVQGAVYSNSNHTSPYAGVTASNTTIAAVWKSPSNTTTASAEVISYTLEWGTNYLAMGNNWFGSLIGTHTINHVSGQTDYGYEITGLSPNTLYYVRVVTNCPNTSSDDGSYPMGVDSSNNTLGWGSGPYAIQAYDSVTTTNISTGCTDGTGAFNNVSPPSNPSATMTTPACNYDPTATFDDGSCEYASCVGCSNPNYLEYYQGNSLNANQTLYPATSPGSPLDAIQGWCATPIVFGCTDPSAINYDPNANQNQVSANDPTDPCCYVSGCTVPCANNYVPCACHDDGSCVSGYLEEGEEFTGFSTSNTQTVPGYISGTPPFPGNTTNLDADNDYWGDVIRTEPQPSAGTANAWEVWKGTENSNDATSNVTPFPGQSRGGFVWSGAAEQGNDGVPYYYKNTDDGNGVGISPYKSNNVLIFPFAAYNQSNYVDPGGGIVYSGGEGVHVVAFKVDGLTAGSNYELEIEVPNATTYALGQFSNGAEDNHGLSLYHCKGDWVDGDSNITPSYNNTVPVGFDFPHCENLNDAQGASQNFNDPGHSSFRLVFSTFDRIFTVRQDFVDALDSLGNVRTGECQLTCPDGINWSMMANATCADSKYAVAEWNSGVPGDGVNVCTSSPTGYGNSAIRVSGDFVANSKTKILKIPFEAFTNDDDIIYLVNHQSEDIGYNGPTQGGAPAGTNVYSGSNCYNNNGNTFVQGYDSSMSPCTYSQYALHPGGKWSARDLEISAIRVCNEGGCCNLSATFPVTSSEGLGTVAPVYGCMDTNANNYDFDATNPCDSNDPAGCGDYPMIATGLSGPPYATDTSVTNTCCTYGTPQ